MSRQSSLSLLLLLLLAKSVLTFGINQKTTTTKDQLKEKNNRRIPNTILKKSEQIPPNRQPTSNHLSHLLGYLGYSSYENSTHIRRDNKTCLKIHCVKDHYVRSCDFDGGNDTCERCAEGTFLSDDTSSQQYNHECVSYPECFPDATISRTPYFCANHHRMYCKCDVTRKFCGLDPCKCSKGHCHFSTPVLTVNCGCDRLPTTTTTTTTIPTTTTTTMTTTTKEMSSIKSTKRAKVSSTPVHSSPQTTNEQTSSTTTRPTTIKPGSGEEDTGLSEGIIALIIILIILYIVIGTCGVIYYQRRQKSDDGKGDYSPPEDSASESDNL